tara:strand:+ start:959 stop:2680 length:1722 start_codon:yes stop_codon:yes gene_type:complete
MNKFYSLIFLLSIPLLSFSQIIITEIADPNNDSSARFIEIANIGQDDFDLTGYELIRWTNANSNPTASATKALDQYVDNGTLQSGAIIVLANNNKFNDVYGFAPTAVIGTGGVADSNGDDNIAIRDSSGNIYDLYGVPGVDGTGQPHEFEDGRAERKGSVTGPESTWDSSQWNIDNDGGAGDGALDAPGGYDPGSWIGFSSTQTPTLSFSSPNNNSTIYSDNVDISLSIENFTVGNGTGDGHIHYSVDGGGTIMKYDTDDISLTGLTEGAHSVVVSLVDNSHNALDPAVESTLNFTVDLPTQVSDLSGLRSAQEGEAITVTGEIILTYKQSFRNAKVFQDASAGIYVDDNSGVITTSYDLGDGVSGLTGTLSSYNGLLQFTPISDAGAASSTGNVITPVTLTLGDLSAGAESYESQLVKVEGVTATGNDGETTFINGKIYTLTQGADTFPMRTTFYNFSGEDLPTSAFDLEGIINERSGVGLHLAPRSYSDLTLSIISFDNLELAIYPNPVQTKLNFLGLSSPVQATVFDMLGKRQLQSEVTNSLDVSQLKSGLYMVEIKNENSAKVFNIIKK